MRKVIALSKQSKKAQKSLPRSAARQLEWAKPHHPHCPQRQGVLQGKGKGRGPQGRLPSFFCTPILHCGYCRSQAKIHPGLWA